ncbi:MAG: cytochrome c [Pedosphaera sp.]|nr:cytochrome c [Pedosphaera sp.]
MKSKIKLLITVASLSLVAWSAQAADLKENWDKHCVACHGKDGKGDTKAGKKAQVKDFTDSKYLATLTDDKMFKQIKEGMKEGTKEKMKPFGDKLSDEETKALVAYVRTFKK